MANEFGNPGWASLPRKGQLLVLCLIRVTEPLTRFCINSYIFYQLQYLDPSLRKDEIIQQASYLRSAYTLAQCVSSFLWVRVADSPLGGRKLVMLLTLSCSFFSVLGLGFASSFKQALVFHAAQGFSNSNIAIVRTLVSEVVPQERFQARAFGLLPICTSIAAVLGPPIASLTIEAEPQTQVNDQVLLKRYPYAMPALINSMLLLLSLLATFFFLEETLEPLRGRYDPGLAAFRRLASLISGLSRRQQIHYEAIPLDVGRSKEMEFAVDTEDEDQTSSSGRVSFSPDGNLYGDKTTPFLPTKRIFTKNMLSVLLAFVLLEIQVGVTSDAMFNLFSFPVASKEQERRMVLPFRFTGGAGFQPSSLAWTTCIFGIMKLPFQLFLYPRVAQRLGVLNTWRYFLYALPLIWCLYPYFVVLPSNTPPPSEKTGVYFWAFVVFLASASGLLLGCVTPCQLILTAQSSPHPSALGRTQNITFFVCTGVSASSAALSGSLLAYGLNRNLAGLPFWFSAVIGVVAISISPFVKEGNGHEIRLLGDE